MDHSRDPCPWVILNDFGGAFAMVPQLTLRRATHRRHHSDQSPRTRSRGNFGVWGGLFNTYDCAVKGIRKKEDPWNAIIAGFFTGGSLAVRGGYKSMRNGAISCAILLAVIEGVSIGFNRMMADNTRLEAPPPPPSDVGASSGGGGMAVAA
ncbi:hypothetical protein CFE70_009608 [Pyrenophora teres f. teres 0-1]